MTIFAILLIVFLVSLFIGTTKVYWGLGVVVCIITFCNFVDHMGWLDK